MNKVLVEQILSNKEQGKSKYQIAKELNITHSTVRYWWNYDFARVAQLAEAQDLKSCQREFESHLGYHYAHLLGLYLGDGYINKHNSSCYKLRITCHAEDSIVINDCMQSMKALFINKVNKWKHTNANCVDVYIYSNDIPKLFPQHGKGRKHERKIALESWQKDIINEHPLLFIKGLMQSDGSRFIRNIENRSYASYIFCNVSKDIIDILYDVCIGVGLSPTIISLDNKKYKYSRSTNILYRLNFNKRKDVELLDNVIGTKK